MNDLIAMVGVFGFVVLAVLLMIAAVLYLFLPFAVFGIKTLLKEQNERLSEISEYISSQNDKEN